jgi:hypothetical protein
MKVLKLHFNLLPYAELTAFFSDDEPFDADLHSFYQRVLVDLDRVAKELKVVRGMTTHRYLKTAEDLLSIKVLTSVMIGEDTCCDACGNKIGIYPFCWEYSSGRILH